MSINKAILEGCINYNKHCQEQVYQHYYGYLLTIGNRYIADIDDSKLMVNESFFKAFTKIDQYDISIPFEIWIRRIMINNCIDFLRKNKKEKYTIPLQNHEIYYATNSESYAEINIASEYLEKLLLSVPSTSRKVFSLFAIEGYSHKEISELLEINEGTSKWHVNNARKILKEKLSEYVKKNKVTVYAK
jgi:RNA polymerase sigma-70 factor (ECF subfamily)